MSHQSASPLSACLLCRLPRRGYVTFLSPYKHDQKIAQDHTDLNARNQTKILRAWFRDDKVSGDLPHGRLQSPTDIVPANQSDCCVAKAKPRQWCRIALPVPGEPSLMPVISPTGAASWVISARNGLPPSSRMIDITPAKRDSDGNAKKYYLVNAQNERVDEPLPKPPQQAYDQMTSRIRDENGGLKFCNQCNFFGPETCDKSNAFRHGKANLTPGEELVLRQMVRGLPCSSSSWCADVKCPYGHNCKYGPKCTNAMGCKFASTHHVNGVC